MARATDLAFKKGRKYFFQEKYRLAVGELLKARGEGDINPDVFYYLGLSHIRLHEYIEAKEALMQTLTRHYDYLRMFQIRMLLGYIYARLQNYPMAEQEFQKAIKLNFNSASAHAALGHVFFMQDKYDAAIEVINKAIEIDPDNSNAQNSAGYIKIDTERDVAEGIQNCEKALKTAPDNPYIMDSLGWGYFKMGKLAQSKEIFKKAFQKLSDNKILRRHYTEVLNTK